MKRMLSILTVITGTLILGGCLYSTKSTLFSVSDGDKIPFHLGYMDCQLEGHTPPADEDVVPTFLVEIPQANGAYQYARVIVSNPPDSASKDQPPSSAESFAFYHILGNTYVMVSPSTSGSGQVLNITKVTATSIVGFDRPAEGVMLKIASDHSVLASFRQDGIEISGSVDNQRAFFLALAADPRSQETPGETCTHTEPPQ